jgi:predicted negative regulator of RcsB-dependent stress response
MSVINQMLRDLESRKQDSDSSQHYVDQVNIVAGKKIRLWWIILPLIVLLLLLGNFFWHEFNQKKIQAIQLEAESLNKGVHPVDTNVTKVVVPIQQPKTEEITPQLSVTITTIEKNKTETVQQNLNQQVAKTQSSKIEVAKNEVIKTPPVNNKPEKALAQSTAQRQTDANQVIKLKSVPENNDKSRKPVIVKTTKNDEILQQARVLMEQDHSRAILYLEKHIKTLKKPGSDIYALMGNLYQRTGQYQKAINVYREALAISPEQGTLWMGIALAYMKDGQDDKSQVAFRSALNTKDLSPALKKFARQQLQ